MDFQSLFLCDFSITKKPDNLLDLIERAVAVAEFKYPAELEKRRNRIIKCMLNPGKFDYDDEDKDQDDDDDDCSTLDDDEEEEDEEEGCVGDKEEEEDCVGDKDGVTNNEEEEKQQITVPTNQKPTTKIKLIIKKSVEVAAPRELKETDLVDKQLDANKETTRQSHTMGTTRKRNVPTQVASKKLVSDFSFEKQLDGDKQQSYKGFKKIENLKSEQRRECTTKRMPPPLMKMYAATKPKIVAPTQKQSHKGFKKMENLKSEQRKVCTSALTRRMPPPLMKMNAVTKREIVAPTPHQKELLSDCSPKKQSNRSAITTRPMQKTTQRSEVMQKETESIRDMNMKFESSKRKFEERFAEQREAKRRIKTLDFNDMPKPPNNPCAPPTQRRFWNRKRF